MTRGGKRPGAGRPRGTKPAMRSLVVRLPKELHERLTRDAQWQKASVSELVRAILDGALPARD